MTIGIKVRVSVPVAVCEITHTQDIKKLIDNGCDFSCFYSKIKGHCMLLHVFYHALCIGNKPPKKWMRQANDESRCRDN